MKAPNQTDPKDFVEQLRSTLASHVPKAEPSEGAKPAGVLIPLHYHHGTWHVIVNVRSNEVGLHKGELAFPGGKLEPSDIDMTACALRETWEEMGVRPDDIDVLGVMNARTTRTNFLLWPTVGVIPYPYSFNPDPREVAEIVELPLPELVDGTAVRYEGRLGSNGKTVRRASYIHNQHVVFGATAFLLGDLLELIVGLGSHSEIDSRNKVYSEETFK